MQHHEQRVRGIALRDQHLPAHQILTDHGAKRLQALFRTERSKQRKLLQRVPPRKWGAPLTHFWRDRLDCVGRMLAPPGPRGEEYKGRKRKPAAAISFGSAATRRTKCRNPAARFDCRPCLQWPAL